MHTLYLWEPACSQSWLFWGKTGWNRTPQFRNLKSGKCSVAECSHHMTARSTFNLGSLEGCFFEHPAPVVKDLRNCCLLARIGINCVGRPWILYSLEDWAQSEMQIGLGHPEIVGRWFSCLTWYIYCPRGLTSTGITWYPKIFNREEEMMRHFCESWTLARAWNSYIALPEEPYHLVFAVSSGTPFLAQSMRWTERWTETSLHTYSLLLKGEDVFIPLTLGNRKRKRLAAEGWNTCYWIIVAFNVAPLQVLKGFSVLVPFCTRLENNLQKRAVLARTSWFPRI